jgi:hypothetical protein
MVCVRITTSKMSLNSEALNHSHFLLLIRHTSISKKIFLPLKQIPEALYLLARMWHSSPKQKVQNDILQGTLFETAKSAGMLAIFFKTNARFPLAMHH